MTTAIAIQEPPAPLVTAEQVDLVRKTVANGATDAELKLYLFDCARQGVHPLDRLLHFTKRGGKYTPVTSIDLMRTRAADTGEYAGSDDAAFQSTLINGVPREYPDVATVTVWRLVQGQRCAFTATARWSEYYPGDTGGSMWRKMPHTMLAKCAEALALRKGFPRQLAGLYAKEELDQAEKAGGYVVDAPAHPAPIPVLERRENGPAPSLGDSGHLTIVRVERKGTKNPNVTKHIVVLSDGRECGTIKDQIGALCEELCYNKEPVTVETKKTQWGDDLIAVHRVQAEGKGELLVEPELDVDSIPFAWLLPLVGALLAGGLPC